MNIQEENSARYFRVQSEREQTFSFQPELLGKGSGPKRLSIDLAGVR